MNRMHRSIIALSCGAAILTLEASVPRRSTLAVFAAASLNNAFNEIADSLKRRQPDLRIDVNYAGSQALALQIGQGASADVFASADDHWMTVIRGNGFVSGAPRVFAHNRLVLITPESNPARIEGWQDLARTGVKLVLADGAVPAGHYARIAIAALDHISGFPSGYSQTVLRNVVSNEDNVKGVVAKVQLGEADAGIVYVSDVTSAVAKGVNRIEIPAAANVIVSYPIAVLRRSPNPGAARAFVDLVLSPIGQAVLERNGFVPVGAIH
jgi:molybdate transport system substrate-binding protein